MQINSAKVALTGESGDGIMSLGEILTKVLSRMGLNVLTFRTYPAEVRGGQCIFTINTLKDEVLSLGDDYDILLCTDATSYELNRERLKRSGVLIYNAESIPKGQVREVGYGVPLKSLTAGSGIAKAKNVLMLGVMANLFGLDIETIKAILSERWGWSAETLKRNATALKTGWDWAAANVIKKDGFSFQKMKAPERLIVSGNEALCLGAVSAGCMFFAGYPITPASDMMEWFMARLPRTGGVALQTEDEMAALGAAIGAGYSGLRAMTATSGPGLALMTEFVNLAGSAEIPVVIVDVQRAGPSTGMPTKTEQSDLNHAAFGGPGEVPRIVLAPTSVEDCFYQMMKAFNLADKYQLPVILLSDQSLSHSFEAIPIPDPSKFPAVQPKRPSGEELKRYMRYLRTEDGVSPMSIPGMAGGMYVATGIERDESGMPNYDPRTHELNTFKRLRKLERAAYEDEEVELYGEKDATIGVIGWGSTTGAIREAVKAANSRGLKVSSLHPKMLYPTPRNQIGAWLLKVREVLVVEVNQTGQYQRLLQGEFGRNMHSLRKSTGLPFEPREIASRIEEVARLVS